MRTTSIFKRTIQVLVITSISVFTFASAHAVDAPEVTAANYVRAESDLQMKLYIDRDECFGKFVHSRKPYEDRKSVV